MDQQNRRIRRTKNILKKELIQLVYEIGYESVTVTNIVKRADYNRSTFYIYFIDKDDLANQLVDEMMEQLKLSFVAPFTVNRSIDYEEMNKEYNNFFVHFYENRSFYRLLIRKDTLPNLNERFLQTLKQLFTNIEYITERNEKINLPYFNLYKLYGSYGVILEWIQGDFSETPAEFSQKLLEIFRTSTSSFVIKEGALLVVENN